MCCTQVTYHFWNTFSSSDTAQFYLECKSHSVTATGCDTATGQLWPAVASCGQIQLLASRKLFTAHVKWICKILTLYQDSPGNNPSSSTSSQGSLHKAPEKKGIKSSISRLFRKKEKDRPEHPSKEALGPGGCFTVQREEGLQASPFCVSPVVPTRLLSITLGVLLGAGVEEASVFSMGLR